MKSGDVRFLRRAGTLAFAVTSTLGLAQQAMGQAAAPPKEDQIIDRVVVTAQKKEEALIDVPIAVSAFDSVALERKQIDQATDLQLNIPNVAYTKTNFTGSNFQIRGIGVSSVGASSDSGVETHFNSVPIKNPRLFETDYFDVERVEVLRGPQGTLYGRNATGGAVNVLPKKPVQGEFSGNIEFEAGNFSELKAKGALNIPMGETVAARFAGISYQRDGFTQNLFTGNDIDGRDQWAARGALRITPSEATDLTLTVNHYKEDSSRARVIKQMCHRDPTAVLGCLPDRLAFETVNGRSTYGGIIAEFGPLLIDVADGVVDGLIFGGPLPPALLNPLSDLNDDIVNPPDLRKVNADFDPTYEADETIVTLELSQEIGSFTLIAVTGYQETSFVGRTDYLWNATNTPYDGPALAAFGGSLPLSQIDKSLLGTLDGRILLYSASPVAYDQSEQDAHQWSQEIRLASDFEGALNFQVGAFYMDADDDNSYSIATTELDYGAAIFGLQPPFYVSQTPSASLKSTGIFGELYLNTSDDLKWTAGVRWTRDEKGIRDRQPFLSVPIGSPLPPFRVDETTFEEFTGRFGFDWKPGWFDDATLYAFYSRGYKAGGFNPPIDITNPAFAGTPRVYEPEFIDAFEIGSKNVFAGGRVQANLTAFFYKYDNLQVSKIVARTSVNENINADIYGLEGEFVFRPTDSLTLDLNFAYLNTSIRDAESVDPRDPSDSNPNFVTIKDLAAGGNCVIPAAALAPARAAGAVLPEALLGPFGFCAALEGAGLPVTDGIAADLDGNQLGGSPEWSFKIGAQYVFGFSNGMRLTPRIDYYWRDDFYARIFNKPIDKIESWDVINAQIDLSAQDDSWYVRGFINNVSDDDNLTGMYLTAADSGLFTNVFALEPRTYGVAVGLRF